MSKVMNIIIGILIVFGLSVCTGCSAQQGAKDTAKELDNLAEIQIYSAENHELITTINDEEQLSQYNQCLLLDELDIEERQKELRRGLEAAKEQYYLIAYKYPTARFGNKELQENTTITLYEDTNIIKITVAEESIKALAIPEEFLIFYYELSDEEMDFYRSLVDQ